MLKVIKSLVEEIRETILKYIIQVLKILVKLKKEKHAIIVKKMDIIKEITDFVRSESLKFIKIFRTPTK